jgi:hypothetical protein
MDSTQGVGVLSQQTAVSIISNDQKINIGFNFLL